MKELGFSEYIRNLLLFSGKVTFPGLGALVMVKESAKIKGKRIIPPGTTLIFNPDSLKDDGKLAESIASSGENDIEEARQQVLEFVDQVIFSLNKGEPFVIDGIGKIYRDENNVIQFEKDTGFITDFDSFGLESFELEPEIAEELPVPEVQEKVTESIITVPEEEQIEIPIREERPVIESTGDKGEKRKGFAWYSIGIVTVIIAALILLNLFTGFPVKTLKGVFKAEPDQEKVVQTKDDPEDNLDELKQALDSISKPENPLTIVDKTHSSTFKSTTDSDHFREYHIIAGSFLDTVNAQELARELTMYGYTVIVLKQGNNLYRVSAISFRDKESGLDELHRFRSKTRNNAAWLLELDQ